MQKLGRLQGTVNIDAVLVCLVGLIFNERRFFSFRLFLHETFDRMATITY
jgi:hypothetical protein